METPHLSFLQYGQDLDFWKYCGGIYFEKVIASQLLNGYVLNLCSVNVIWTYYIRHVVIITWPAALLHYHSQNPLSWLYAHFCISPEEAGHPCTFFECCEFRHTSFVTFFHLSREVCDFGCFGHAIQAYCSLYAAQYALCNANYFVYKGSETDSMQSMFRREY